MKTTTTNVIEKGRGHEVLCDGKQHWIVYFNPDDARIPARRDEAGDCDCKETPEVLLPLEEKLTRIQQLAHKHEVQYWLDSDGTDEQKLNRIWHMSCGLSNEVSDMREGLWKAVGELKRAAIILREKGFQGEYEEMWRTKDEILDVLRKVEGK